MRKFVLVPLLLAALLVFALPAPSSAQVSVGVSIHVGPPVLPVYEQPLCPGPGYIWTPGYWAYGPDGYYWVPGTWVVAPVGMLWTPGYWGFGDGVYLWHAGYWGPHVGFYGGINYGFGYGGVGFVGGRWNGRVLVYNTAVTRVDTTVIHNTYVDKTVIVNRTAVNRVSFNGEGGVRAAPSEQERIAEHDRHEPPIQAQMQHEHAASSNHAFLASANHGRPDVAATARPGDFKGPGAVGSRGANNSFHPPKHNDAAAVHSEYTPPRPANNMTSSAPARSNGGNGGQGNGHQNVSAGSGQPNNHGNGNGGPGRGNGRDNGNGGGHGNGNGEGHGNGNDHGRDNH